MPRFLKVLLLLVSLWLLTGVYVVGTKERAAIRRFGQAARDPEGQILLKTNGLHFDWPWPISQVDRINLAEVKTLSVPLPSDSAASTQLLADEILPDPTFLTGDKNLLNVRLTVHYRIAETGVKEFLFRSVSVEDRLACLVESVTADRLSQSGVDYVQVSGLSELRGELTRILQQQSDQKSLGLIIEDVILDDVSPPLPVKADFLDVANARADREQSIQAALSLAEQRRQQALAEARQVRNVALSQAQEMLQSAQGSAARFLQIIATFQNSDESPGAMSPGLTRRLVLEQHYFQAVQEILGNIQGKVFLDTGQQVDLTIWRHAPTAKPEARSPGEETKPSTVPPSVRD